MPASNQPPLAGLYRFQTSSKRKASAPGPRAACPKADAGQVAVGNGLDAQQFGVQQDHFGLVGGAAAFGQLRLEFDDQVVGQELAQAVGFAAVPDGLDAHELLLGLLEEADGVEVARHVPVAVSPPWAARPRRRSGSATGAAGAAGAGCSVSRHMGCCCGWPEPGPPKADCVAGRGAPRRRRTMNNTAKTASAISNADDRNSAKAPDRPMLESSAAMPRPAAMPAMTEPARGGLALLGAVCWTDGPRCCRRQRGAPRRQTKPSPAPRRKRRSALRRKPRKTEFGHGWCAPRTREGGARSAAPANFPYNNLNCIRITDKIRPQVPCG